MAFGRKTGGRQKGIPNKATVVRAAQVAARNGVIVKSGDKLPLDIMLEAVKQVYCGESGKEHNAVAAFPLAREAAPYLHPRLQSIDANHSGSVVVEILRFAK